MLRVRELSVRFHTGQQPVPALDRVSFDLERGGALAVIGESGSGKTTLALSLLRLLPPGAAVTGRAEFSGRDLLQISGRELATVRGTQIAMIFHDPLAALNPVLRIRSQLAECLPERGLPGARARHEQVTELLRTVGLGADAADRYPHELSGGMRQRALIAMALSGRPSLLVADEPTSSLDTVAQAGIVDLLSTLRRKHHLAVLLATHDPALAVRLCDRIAVLYRGSIVELAPAAELMARPRHPYTASLWRSILPGFGEA